MELNRDNINTAFTELISLFNTGDESYDPNEEEQDVVKEQIIDMCGDLYDTDLLTAQTAWVIGQLDASVPSATLISLGVTDIGDYNFDVKSDIKDEIEKIEPTEENNSVREGDETYTENTDMVAVSQSRFKDVLKLLKPAVGTASSMVQNATHVIFDYDHLTTFNGERTVLHPFITRVSGSVPYNYLNEIIGKFGPSDMIEISATSDILKLSSDKIEFTLILDDTSPPNFDVNSLDWVDLPPDFLIGLETCHDSASDDEDIGIISCIKYERDTFIAFDNLSAIKYITDGSIMDTIFIPKKIAKLCLSKFEPLSVALDEKWILFKNKADIIFGGVTMFGTYPSTSGFFKKQTGDIIKFDQKQFTSMLHRASILADEDDNKNKKIELELFPLKLTCRAGNGVGMFQEDLVVQYTGKQMIINAIPKTLINIIKHTDELFISENTIGYATENVFGTINVIV